MSKDLFDYIVIPTDKQYRRENIIDGMLGIPKLNIANSSMFLNPHEYLINDAIVNYNNEIVVAKTFYANMNKYQAYYEKRKNEEYDFWARKYGEQTIKELYSIYDKSIHIINYLFDLKIIPDFSFKENVRSKIKNIDKPFFKRINSIYSRLYGDKYKNVVRDDITHNLSALFVRYTPKYQDEKPTGWYIEEPLPYEEYKKIIDDICSLLVENKQVIIDKISEMYPKKGTKAYNKKREENQKRFQELFEKQENK